MFARRTAVCALALFSGTAAATPDIVHWTLENGARVYFVENRALPMVQIRVVFDAASSRDPEGKSGLAVLTNSLLREGAGAFDADAIAERFESLGAEYGAAAERDMATVDLRSLSDRSLLDPAVDLFARILESPNFPKDGLERERSRLLIALKKERETPGSVINRTFYRSLYHDHPYSSDPSGDESDVRRISRDDMVRHHRRYYVGRNAWLVIVGDLTRGEAKKLSERLIGRLPVGEAAPVLPQVTMPRKPQYQHVRFPATQSHIRIGQPGITRGDPDYFALYVGNYILGGGGLVSRLSDEIRERRGLSYSVYSYFQPMREPGPFVIGLQTKNESRTEALTVVRRVLTEFIADGPSAKELDAAKKHLTGSFPLRLDSNRKIAEYLAVIGFYGLPLTYLDDFIPRIEAVTAEQIRDAFIRRLHPERMVTVIVGGDT